MHLLIKNINKNITSSYKLQDDFQAREATVKNALALFCCLIISSWPFSLFLWYDTSLIKHCIPLNSNFEEHLLRTRHYGHSKSYCFLSTYHVLISLQTRCYVFPTTVLQDNNIKNSIQSEVSQKEENRYRILIHINRI